MASYTSWSVVFGEQPSASKWNIIGTNMSGFNDGSAINWSVAPTIANGLISTKALTNPSKFSVYLTAAQSIGASSTTIVAYDTKVFDTGSNVDIVTNKGRFTAPVAGFYQFDYAVGMAAAGGSTYYAELFKNGTVLKPGARFIQGAGTDTAVFPGSASIQLALNDYVEIAMSNTSGGGKALTTGATSGTYFMGFLQSVT